MCYCIYVIVILIDRFRGFYRQTATNLVSTLTGQSVEEVTTSSSTQIRRKRQTDTSTTTQDEQDESDNINNPLVCIQVGESFLFQISNESYPMYDRNSLYNTNPNFDYGQFELSAEMQRLTGQNSLFPFQFNEEGIYTFALSSNSNRKFVVRVVGEAGQCPDTGPFFPMSPSNVIQLGINRSDDILQAPNWVLIGSMLAGGVAILGIVIIALVSCKSLQMHNIYHSLFLFYCHRQILFASIFHLVLL